MAVNRLDLRLPAREAFTEHMSARGLRLHGTMAHALEAYRIDPRTMRWNDFLRRNRHNVRLFVPDGIGHNAGTDGGLIEEGATR